MSDAPAARAESEEVLGGQAGTEASQGRGEASYELGLKKRWARFQVAETGEEGVTEEGLLLSEGEGQEGGA